MNQGEIISNIKNYPTLYSIFTESWIKEKIKTQQLKVHPIINLLSYNRKNYQRHLKFLEKNVQLVLTKLKSENAEKKINNMITSFQDREKFHETLVEMSWYAKWIQSGILMEIEPNFPEQGPDAQIRINGRECFCEITALNLSNEESKNDNFFIEIQNQTHKIDSPYLVTLMIKGDLDLSDVKPLCKHISEIITKAGGKDSFSVDYSVGYEQKATLIFKKNEGRSKTGLLFSGKFTSETTSRIEKAILKKISQLKQSPEASPKIIIIDLLTNVGSEEMADFAIIGRDREYDGEVIYKENVFSKSTSISAVITVPRYIVKDDELELGSIPYLNSNAQIPLSKEEIQQII